MKTKTISAILVLALVQTASAAQTLTMNSEAVDEVTLKTGQSCIVKIVSDNSNPYSAYVGFDDRVVLGSFGPAGKYPEAGDLASITEYDIPAFYGYFASAAGTSPTPSPGNHFVIVYRPQQVGETELKLYDITLTSVIDSVHITVVPAQMGTAFTYQGRLMDADHPAEGQYDFTFMLYDAPSYGNQMQSKIDINDLNVIDGYFTVELDFSSSVFNGDARWLEVSVRPGDSNDPNAFVTLSPRQQVTSTPYALQTRGIFVDDSGNVCIGGTDPWYALDVYKAVSDSWVAGFHNTGTGSMDGGVIVRAFGGDPLLVQSATANVLNVKQNGNVGIGTTTPRATLEVNNSGSSHAIWASTSDIPVYAHRISTGGTWPAVNGDCNSESSGASGVRGRILSTSPGSLSAGVYGYNYSKGSNGVGVRGYHDGAGAGVYGRCDIYPGKGVYGESSDGYGVYGENDSGCYGYLGGGQVGVNGRYKTGNNYGYIGGPEYGVYGYSLNDRGVRGEGGSQGVYGASTSGTGVYGYSSSGYAGYFEGNVYVTKNVSALSFTDRTPYPKDLATAYQAVMSMERLPDGQYDENNRELQLDHSKLSDFIKSKDGNRDLSATVSCHNEVLKNLIRKQQELTKANAYIEQLQERINNLEEKMVKLEAILNPLQ